MPDQTRKGEKPLPEVPIAISSFPVPSRETYEYIYRLKAEIAKWRNGSGFTGDLGEYGERRCDHVLDNRMRCMLVYGHCDPHESTTTSIMWCDGDPCDGVPASPCDLCGLDTGGDCFCADLEALDDEED